MSAGNPNQVVLGITAEDNASGAIDGAVGTFEQGTKAMEDAAAAAAAKIAENAEKIDEALGQQGKAAGEGAESLERLEAQVRTAGAGLEQLGTEARETRGDLDVLGGAAEQARAEVDQLGDEAVQAGQRLSSAAGEVRELTDELRRVSAASDDAASELKEAERVLRGGAGDAARSYAEAARSVDALSRAVEAAQRSGQVVSPESLENLERAKQQLQELQGVASGLALDKAFVGAETGSREAVKQIRTAGLFLEQMRARVEELHAAGSPVPPKALADLAEMEDRFEAVKRRMSEVSAAHADLTEDLKAGQAEFEREAGNVGSLNDLLQLGGSKWAGYGAQVAGVIGSFKVGYEIGGKVRDALNGIGKELGLGERAWDDFAGKVTQSAKVAELWVRATADSAEQTGKLTDKVRDLNRAQAEQASEDLKRQADREAARAKAEAEADGASLEEATAAAEAAVQEFYRRMEFLHREAREAAAESLRESIAGVGAKELASEFDELRLAVDQFKLSGRDLADFEKVLPGTTARILELNQAAERLGTNADTVQKRVHGVTQALSSFDIATATAEQVAGLEKSLAGLRSESLLLVPQFGDGFAKALEKVEAQAGQLLAGDGSVPALKAAVDGLLDSARKSEGQLDAGLVKGLRQLLAEVGAAGAAFEKLGVTSVEALSSGVAELQRYISAAGGFGGLVGDEGAIVVRTYQEMLAAIEALPDGQRAAAEDIIRSLEDIKAGAEAAGAPLLSAFGVKTPESLRSSAESVSALAKAFGPLGTVTEDQAAKVVSAAREILDQIELLPQAQRESVEQQRAQLEALAESYGALTEEGKKQIEDLAKAEEEAAQRSIEAGKQRAEALRQVAATIGQEMKALLEASQGPDQSAQALQDARRLREEIEQISSKAIVDPEETARLDELRKQLRQTEQQARGVTGAFEALTQQHAQHVVSAAEVREKTDGIAEALLKSNEAAEQLGEEGLAAVARQLEALNSAGVDNRASNALVERSLRDISATLDQYGVSIEEVDSLLGRAGSSSDSMGASLAKLKDRAKDAGDALGKLGSAGEKNQEGFDKTLAAIDEVQVKIDQFQGRLEKLREHFEANIAQMSQSLGAFQAQWEGINAVLQTNLDLSQQLKECWGSLKLGA